MKLKIWKNQHEAEKTYECQKYDLMFGTVEDALSIIDSIADLDMDDEESVKALFRVIKANLPKVNELLKDMFSGVTDEELKKVKVAELVPIIAELAFYIRGSFGGEKK